MMRTGRRFAIGVFVVSVCGVAAAQMFAQGRGGQGRGGGAGGAAQAAGRAGYLLKPARVFDGDSDQPHEGWVVRVNGPRIEAAGPAAGVSAEGATVVDLPDTTV